MKTTLSLLALLFSFLSPSARAAVAEGENLLLNGRFDAEQVDFPEFWTPSSSREVAHSSAGGPGGNKPCIVLKSSGPNSGTVSARQQGLTLVAGESYKLSVWVKTKGFKNHSGGVIVHNNGWTSATGITNLPPDSEWTHREKILTLPASKNHEYGLAIYASQLEGELHVADLHLEAISEAARRGSTSQAALVAAPRLVPIQPLLNRVPLAKPELTFKLFGLLPESKEAYECIATISGNSTSRLPIPVGKDGRIVISLAGHACGDHSVKAAVRHRQTQKVVLEAEYPVTLVDLPTIDRSHVRPLNNLVSVLLDQRLAEKPGPQSFTFAHPRDGWVFVSYTSPAPAPDLAIRIDDGEPLITASTDRLEAFRELPMGEHRLTVTGNRGEARLVVRSIPEIFDYPPCASSQVKENGSYGWDFMKKHVLPAVTTLNGGTLPGPALGEAKKLGLKWLANFNVAPADDAEAMRTRMEKHAGLTQPQFEGFTSDELFFGRTTIDNYTRALRLLRNPDNRLVYTWIVGKPGIASLHTDFMSAALNVSKGRGRLLFEAYCHPAADEKAASAYLDGMIGETMRRFHAFYPNAAAGTGIIFGNFNQIPIISLETNPAVDFKYFLDMQVNLVANSPEFKDLATIGYWGTYYGDEELVRWSFLLMRHYAVEGSKELLSPRYGFRYNLGFLTNGDFENGLQGWTASPASENSIRAGKVPGYGKSSQARWNAGNAGDTVCILARQAGKPNVLRQTARGLQPGKAYCLQFVTADFNDVSAKLYHPRQYGIRAELKGAEVLPAKSFVHVDHRKTGANGKEANVGKIDLNRIVFRARSTEQALVFTDEAAQPGEELLLNFVQLKPYLE